MVFDTSIKLNPGTESLGLLLESSLSSLYFQQGRGSDSHKVTETDKLNILEHYLACDSLRWFCWQLEHVGKYVFMFIVYTIYYSFPPETIIILLSSPHWSR